jgi:hypothetical protein
MNRWHKEVGVKVLLYIVTLVVLGVAGCAGKGERIDVAIPGNWTAAPAASSAGPRIAVLPFDDQRVNQSRLGQRDHLWGGNSYFDVPKGTVSAASAQALVDYLNRRGWRASLANAPGRDGADVTILGTITDLSIDAKSRFMHTDLSAKSSLAFQITNHSDDSIVRERVSGAATNQVFWFTADDAQSLFTDLLESNFQKFMSDVRIEGRAIRLK